MTRTTAPATLTYDDALDMARIAIEAARRAGATATADTPLTRHDALAIARNAIEAARRAADVLPAPASLPQLCGRRKAGWDGRYRVYTIEHLPYDALPPRNEGGPAQVALGVWNTSTSRGFTIRGRAIADDDGMVTLNVFRLIGPGVGVVVRHALDGTKYATEDDADRAAYEAGMRGFMVYERDAAKYGLPSVDGPRG